MLKDIIKSGKWISVTFQKANGEISKVSGRTGVTKYLKGGISTVKDHNQYITVYDLKRGYRNVNVLNIISIRANNTVYDLEGI